MNRNNYYIEQIFYNGIVDNNTIKLNRFEVTSINNKANDKNK
jgi:hypothetical protein